MEPLSVGEFWQRAPLSFVLTHVGAFAVGYYVPVIVEKCAAWVLNRVRKT